MRPEPQGCRSKQPGRAGVLRAVQIRDPKSGWQPIRTNSPVECAMGDDRHRDFLCPKLLIADEPTTGPDVTTQKVVMDLLAAIAAERGWRRS